MADTSDSFNHTFQPRPKIHALEQRVHEIRDGAVEGIFRIAVMYAVVAGRLEDTPVLELRDQPAVFGASAVRPFVNLVRVDADDDKQPELPREQTERIGCDEHQNAGPEEIL